MEKSIIINVLETASKFKFIRKSNGLTKEELSRVLNRVPVSLISDIENGDFIPTLEYVFDFCNYFKISLDEVIVSII